MKRILLTIALLFGMFAFGACEPSPGRIAVTGDSITFNAGYDGSTFINAADTGGKVVIGGRASDTLARVQADVNNSATSPQCLVIAFGQNEAGNDGVLTQDEKNAMYALTFAAHSSARVVWIKPHRVFGPANVMAALEEVRTTIDILVAARPNTAVLDWRERFAPGDIHIDGIHLNYGVGAGQKYGEMMREGCSA